jgi:hypothetical protein
LPQLADTEFKNEYIQFYNSPFFRETNFWKNMNNFIVIVFGSSPPEKVIIRRNLILFKISKF